MTTAHPDLSALLRGDLGNAEALAAAEHARTCEPCHAELVDLALGHGLLRAARGTLGPGTATSEASQEDAPDTGLPAELRDAVRRGRRRRVPAGPAVAVAAVAVVVAGGLGVAAGVLGSRESAPPAVAGQQSATLEAVPGSGLPGVTGRVSMAAERGHVTRMRLDAGRLPSAPKGEFYYAWLFDPATSKMLPLGQVTPGHVATFDMPESLVASYSAVDVSLEADDGDPAHSVTSVLRARYTPPDGSRRTS